MATCEPIFPLSSGPYTLQEAFEIQARFDMEMTSPFRTLRWVKYRTNEPVVIGVANPYEYINRHQK